jgi:DNA-binding transcriptional MerR regulator
MNTGRRSFKPRLRAAWVQAMRALGFAVAENADALQALMGTVQALAEENDGQAARLATLEAELAELRERVRLAEARAITTTAIR